MHRLSPGERQVPYPVRSGYYRLHQEATRPDTADPVRALWAGVILQALKDTVMHVPAARTSNPRCRQVIAATGRRLENIRDEAFEWIRSDRFELGSFLWCADVVGLSAEAVRDQVRNGTVEIPGLRPETIRALTVFCGRNEQN